MRRHAIILGLTLAGLAVFAVLAGWGLFQVTASGWASLATALPFVLGGLSVVGLAALALLSLAFHSAHRDYDDSPHHDGR